MKDGFFWFIVVAYIISRMIIPINEYTTLYQVTDIGMFVLVVVLLIYRSIRR
ncbi:hypothetical protein [Risungbinella massiliensis]|uniref:hypothetical protein n=1 Tax=Risungbinella massiliensis TaxID=1329796 RepID=UPI0012B53782|nr:hypothetical protein [Risungbinella massiliensis]